MSHAYFFCHNHYCGDQNSYIFTFQIVDGYKNHLPATDTNMICRTCMYLVVPGAFYFRSMHLYYSQTKLNSKFKSEFFSRQTKFRPTRLVVVTVKMSTTDTCELIPIQVQENKVCTFKASLWETHGKIFDWL